MVDVLTRRALNRALLERQFLLRHNDLGAGPASMAYAVSYLTPLVQVPPRGVWGRTGPAAWTPLVDWLGPARVPPLTPDALVLRYLGAFGPAGLADVRRWSGLTGLREVVDGLRPDLVVLRDEHGAELLDLPDAPRPDPDVPAPVRFLPEYDNVLLSHADRTRVIPDGRPVPLPPGNGAAAGTVLVDGVFRAAWAVARTDGRAALTVRAVPALSTQDSTGVEAEALRLLAFTDPDAEPEVRFG
jgi:hypothetical protein